MSSPAAECWQAWFDGSALPNPGRLGLGIVLRGPDGRELTQSLRPQAAGCNNEAELQALCAVLGLASSHGVRCLQVWGDSDVSVRYVNGSEQTLIPRLLPWIAAARDLLAGFEQVTLKWVPRHRNQQADALSRQALGLAVKPLATPHAQRKRHALRKRKK